MDPDLLNHFVFEVGLGLNHDGNDSDDSYILMRLMKYKSKQSLYSINHSHQDKKC